MLTLEDVNSILRDYIRSPDGRAALAAEGESVCSYTDAEIRQIANRLYNDIIVEYLSLVKHKHKFFDRSTVVVNPVKTDSKGNVGVSISFREKGLRRRSLHTTKSAKGAFEVTGEKYLSEGSKDYFTGPGVYDIIGLFVNGYTLKGRAPAGMWWDNQDDTGETEDYVRAKRHRAGVDFITPIIRRYEAMYEGLNITYPKEWGGTK